MEILRLCIGHERKIIRKQLEYFQTSQLIEMQNTMLTVFGFFILLLAKDGPLPIYISPYYRYDLSLRM